MKKTMPDRGIATQPVSLAALTGSAKNQVAPSPTVKGAGVRQ